MIRGLAALGVVIGGCFYGAQALSQDVILRATDGSTEFSGQLIDFNGTVYTIETRLGTLNIPAAEVACIGDGCPASNQVTSEFRVVGDRSILRGAMPELLDAYSLEVDTDIIRDRTPEGTIEFELLSLEGEPVVNVEFVEAASSDLFAALNAGDAVIAITSQRISDEQATNLTGRDRRALEALSLEQVVGLDGLVAVVGAEVGITSISVEDIARILSGEVTNWSQLGGADSPISAFTREPGSDIRTVLERDVMAANGREIAANVIAVDSNSGVANAVKTFPNSIGLTSFGAVTDSRMLAIRDECGVDIAPDAFTIKSETYPLSARIYIYERPGTIPVHARGLVDFAASDLGQQVIEDTGYMDLRPVSASESQGFLSLMEISADSVSAEDVASLEAMRDATRGAERLSTTFRLNTSGQLDARAKVDMEQLARIVRSGGLDGQELIMVGFPSGGTTGVSGTDLAREVVSRFFAFDPSVEEQIAVGFRLLGYSGGTLPACTTGAAGELGRIEVWVKPLQQG